MLPASNPDPRLNKEVWIAERDEHGRTADARFIQAGYVLAKRLLYYRNRELRDTSRAAEILEAAVHSASRSEHEEPVKNFAAYLVRRFTRMIDSVVHREARFDYVEPHILAEKHYTLDEDLERLDNRIRLNQVMSYMDADIRLICIGVLHGYTMAEIARELGITSNVLHLRFRRGCKKALDRLESGDPPLA
jgi:DNA-directed RNA polymerase specialized sigma24 family protein